MVNGTQTDRGQMTPAAPATLTALFVMEVAPIALVLARRCRY
jgi:hypothetical protein